MKKVNEVAQNVFLIDCFFAGLPDQCGVYLLRGEKNVLIDSGPSQGVEHVIEGLEGLDIDGMDVHYILLTHIHLDHAGGASFLLDHFPQARVLVSENSSRYLVNPEKLVRSAGRALGDIALFYGVMRPIPAEKIIPLRDGYDLDLGGGMSIRAVHTPGHSSGHFAFLESGTRALFCGDSLGHFIEGSGYIFPATPPPEFDMELSIASAKKLADLEPTLLLFNHFGSSDRVQEYCDEFIRRLERFVHVVEGGSPEENLRFLTDYMLNDLPQIKEEESGLMSGIMEVNAAGILYYLQKKEDS
ncbi:MAG: MBL fold metallo-hydrolase [Actinomycetota bacterium]|nr:MBL fold metallo-hydrolase [Actinomycetota bacterium]